MHTAACTAVATPVMPIAAPVVMAAAKAEPGRHRAQMRAWRHELEWMRSPAGAAARVFLPDFYTQAQLANMAEIVPTGTTRITHVADGPGPSA
jgi:hypothetical protein